MESEDDERYPKYGKYGNPKTATVNVCKWCGKAEVSWQLSGETCSHKCHGALHWKSYRNSLFPIIVLTIWLWYSLLEVYSVVLVGPIVGILTIMMTLWIPYNTWLVIVGKKMRERQSDVH